MPASSQGAGLPSRAFPTMALLRLLSAVRLAWLHVASLSASGCCEAVSPSGPLSEGGSAEHSLQTRAASSVHRLGQHLPTQGYLPAHPARSMSTPPLANFYHCTHQPTSLQTTGHLLALPACVAAAPPRASQCLTLRCHRAPGGPAQLAGQLALWSQLWSTGDWADG